MTGGRVDRPRGLGVQQEELQRIARLVEFNRQKMARLEEQITKLAEVRLEQLGVIAALRALDTGQQTMFPLGAGVQLPATPAEDSIVIDIGSGVQVERPRTEAVDILESRLVEIEEVLSTLEKEFKETEIAVGELASIFTEAAASLQAAAEPTADDESEKPTRQRRRRGSELTLDD
jgi:prefoldin alpha subunit